jgi:DNA-binding HxlR family transcriptional regulator
VTGARASAGVRVFRRNSCVFRNTSRSTARGAPLTVISARLRELRDAQLVTAAPKGYRLTDLGESLLRSLQPVSRWATLWAAELAGD